MPEHKEKSTTGNCAEGDCSGGCAKKSSPHLWGRREVVTGLGWLSVLGATGAVVSGMVRFMFPKVLFEPAQVFRAGFPHEYAIGTVDTRWVRDQRVWIVREPAKIYAVSAICTHLGCTPVWLTNEDKFKCPCHGSGFYKTGINFEGPAPRPLERYRISLAEDGQILIDKSKKFQQEKGEWNNPESFLVC